MSTWDAFYGPNVGYAVELYERYLQDPNAVDAKTRAFFEQMSPSGNGGSAADVLPPPSAEPGPPGTRAADAPAQQTAETDTPVSGNGASATATAVAASAEARPRVSKDLATRIVLAARLARSIRQYGHLEACIDPLNASRPSDPMLDCRTHGISDEDLAELPATIVWPSAGPEVGTCLDAIRRLREIYCGTLGYEVDHVQDFTEREWLHRVIEAGSFRAPLSADRKRALLRRLTEVEGFERFLHAAFVGQKRFSIEGIDSLVPMLDQLVQDAVETGSREILMGMAHRGRLNVLAHVLGKPYASIFSEFHAAPNKDLVPSEGSTGINHGWTGDVKYHLGARRMLHEDDFVEVQITLADNPSHLEFVNPVVEGFARAAQDDRGQPGAPGQDVDRALAITIHGDAAFPGEGVVAETLNLSRLAGYQTGGTIHVIANNQIGFTTGADAGRSTLYASDLAKGFEVPIIHVNADDPEACLSAVRLAHAYRHRFHKDFLIDLVGYRRWGHNEGDEPGFTQPLLYESIAHQATVRGAYADKLAAQGLVSPGEIQTIQREVRERLEKARDSLATRDPEADQRPLTEASDLGETATAVPADLLREMNESLLERPEGVGTNPKLERVLARRREALDRDGGIDWALAETLSFASILADGTPIRLTGQDTERGTFSQRHLVLHDPDTGQVYVPLQGLTRARASFAVYNSPLTESAAIGFEYGYSVHAPEALVLWEAQFGDFANAGQVLIDQFIAGARAKWRKEPSLVLLLPHGYEGQGPEHSSARLERYLQLAAEDNLRVANCTTAAQYFHLLRVQAATLTSDRRPLVVMTPKSLLRHPLAASSLNDLSEGHFQPVMDDAGARSRRDAVERLVFCSGKVAVDLTITARARPEAVDWVAVARVELLYPFPEAHIRRVLSNYPNLREAAWLQEEPRNMGAWTYIAPRLRQVLPDEVPLHYIGRPERASTAEGSPDDHDREQKRIIAAAFEGERPPAIETHGVEDVS